MIQNMRDLGGIRNAGGKTIRPGCLVRSAKLEKAEEQDLVGISEVIDLRTQKEREEIPDVLCGRAAQAIPIFDNVRSGVSHEREAEQKAERKGPPDMGSLYVWMMREHWDSFAKVLTAILRHDYSEGAVLWHCTEGKDRCGLTTALILELLGVDRSVIMEDYLKTNEVSIPKAEGIRERVRAEHGDEVAESVYRAFIADRNYLEGAWSVMDEEEDFLGKLGLSDEDVARFKATVLI